MLRRVNESESSRQNFNGECDVKEHEWPIRTICGLFFLKHICTHESIEIHKTKLKYKLRIGFSILRIT